MNKIIIRGELTDLNTYIGALNSSRWGGNSIKKVETHKVCLIAKTSGVKPVVDYPVTIEYRWYSPNRRKDTDNVAFSKKFINDGLVCAGILKDDSRKYVDGFADKFFIDKINPRVEVLIHNSTIAGNE